MIDEVACFAFLNPRIQPKLAVLLTENVVRRICSTELKITHLDHSWIFSNYSQWYNIYEDSMGLDT